MKRPRIGWCVRMAVYWSLLIAYIAVFWMRLEGQFVVDANERYHEVCVLTVERLVKR